MNQLTNRCFSITSPTIFNRLNFHCNKTCINKTPSFILKNTEKKESILFAIYKFTILEHVTPLCTGIGALNGAYLAQKEIIKNDSIEAIPFSVPLAISLGAGLGFLWGVTLPISFPTTAYICHKLNEKNDQKKTDIQSIRFFIEQELRNHPY